MEQISVVAALLLDQQGRALLAQRPPGKALAGQWEFPGGKVEQGESDTAALCRELAEELAIVVLPDACAYVAHAVADSIDLRLYAVHKWQGDPWPTEASGLAWVPFDALMDYDMPPLDVALIDAVRGFAVSATHR